MEMKTELYMAFKRIDAQSLSEGDKEELLSIFTIIKNSLIRDQLAFIFSDAKYDKAIPEILKKIEEPESYNNNGSLVYALSGFDMTKHLLPVLKIICEQDYEARLMAYGIVEEIALDLSLSDKREAISILDVCKQKLQSDPDIGENSRLHFVEKTQELLQNSLMT